MLIIFLKLGKFPDLKNITKVLTKDEKNVKVKELINQRKRSGGITGK